MSTVTDPRFTIPSANPAIPAQPLCSGQVPLVLLPVRLETRFVPAADGVGTDLLVRVFPDKIHVDTHHPELTTDERTSGIEYWRQDWAAAGEDARADAWQVLASRFGAARAAWIRRVLEPLNATDKGQTGVEPLFPALPPVEPGGESAWRKAPEARLLPDHWTAVVHSGGQVALSATGSAIRPGLHVGPDPEAPEPDFETESAIRAGQRLAVDPGMLWLVDFDEAKDAGMALRIPIPPAVLAAGIDSLMVFGVAGSPDPADTAGRLADLLDAHHYTDGLGFLRFGTPTNNTDDRRAGYDSDDPGHRRSFVDEVLAAGDRPNARRVGAGLGLPDARMAATLGRLDRAGEDHDRDLGSMNTALWQAGWGYFLSNMVGPETGLTTASIDWVRGHFLDYVRAGGPFPSLRCGTQPYGILPATSLDLWTAAAGQPAAPEETRLRDILRALRDAVWRPVANRVSRVRLWGDPDASGPTNPDADLADVMKTDGISHRVATRAVLGRHYLEHLYALANRDFGAVLAAQGDAPTWLTGQLGLNPAQPPRLARCFMDTNTRPVTAPLVQAGEISPWARLEPDYIRALLDARRLDDLMQAVPAPSLLQALLRQSMLREIVTAAARTYFNPWDEGFARLLRDLELVDLVDSSVADFTVTTPEQTLHWRRLLSFPAPGQPTGTSFGDYLAGLRSFTEPAVTGLRKFRASLEHLATLDTESLQYLTQSTLDLSSHRLDAWITSFATKRLALMGATGTGGIHVGAYGWVENLRPAAPLPEVPADLLPPGEAGPVYPLPKDSGFIHAPSLTHGTAAALLRNAQLGPEGEAEPDGPFAIDLSSRRVREASRLLEGVRQGQPLGALLGYRLERRFHELGFDRFIAPLRELAPLAVRERESGGLPTEAMAANNVVDGLVLLRKWKENESAVIEPLSPLFQGTNDYSRVAAEIRALAEAIDGLGDALLAEAAYQVARGNPSRLASTVAAIALGDGAVPELEMARMPRSGNSLTHRVVVLFSGVSNAGGGWTYATARATGERWLNAWIRALLGDARKVRCTVERLDDATGAVAETAAFPLNDVPIAPLDFVYCVEPGARSARADSSPCVAEQRVLYHARRRPGGFGNEAVLRLHHDRPADLAAGETTLFDVLVQARAIRRVLEGSRGLRPEDLAPPGRALGATLDLADLEARMVRYENALNAVHKALERLLAQGSVALAEDLRTAILNLGNFSVEPALPCVAVGDTPEIREALARQAAAMLDISGPRLAKAAALRTRPAAADPRRRCDQLLEQGRAVYGEGFVSLPAFTCDAGAAAELNAALAGGVQQQGGDPLAVHGWFTRCSRVRDPLARLGLCLRTSEVLASGTRLNLGIAQLPFDAAERWVGLPLPLNAALPPGKLSLAVQPLTPIDAALPLCGLFIDEWVELVPNREETTALVFQFDPPNAFAPQTLLVAVPPVPGQDWTTENLRRVLAETLDLARLRAVDTRLLGSAAQYLPGIYVPFNAADAAVSTDFGPLTA